VCAETLLIYKTAETGLTEFWQIPRKEYFLNLGTFYIIYNLLCDVVCGAFELCSINYCYIQNFQPPAGLSTDMVLCPWFITRHKINTKNTIFLL
jgi:hypothetical protein